MTKIEPLARLVSNDLDRSNWFCLASPDAVFPQNETLSLKPNLFFIPVEDQKEPHLTLPQPNLTQPRTLLHKYCPCQEAAARAKIRELINSL